MQTEASQYDSRGRLIHEPRAVDGERLDYYLARRHPAIGDQAFWYSECDDGRVEVRDHFDLATGTFSRTSWFIRWNDGQDWLTVNLESGERPRMRNGFCHIVSES